MSLDVFKSENTGNEEPLISFSLSELDLLEPANIKLKESTGLFIDAFRDTRLSSSHAKIFASKGLEITSPKDYALRDKLNKLNKIAEQTSMLFFEGD